MDHLFSLSSRIALVLFFLGSSCLHGSNTGASATPKPNIIFILADDVSPESFSCYGSDEAVPTPHIDSIASSGIQFETCFAPASCGPSRALLMTGLYANTTGAFSNEIWAFESRKKLFHRHTSWAKLLGENGYATAIAGKWHCNRSRPWSDEVGFDEYCLWEKTDRIEKFTGSNPVTAGLRDKGAGEDRYWDSPMIRNGSYFGTGPEVYGPDARCDFLMDFMKRKTDEGTPFVAYWPTVLVHGPIAKTPHSKRVASEEERFREMVEYLDVLVGRLVDQTRELGIYENTWFVFGADNGAIRVAKNRAVESGVRVPLVISGPGLPATGKTMELSDFSDIAPTLLELGGIHPDNHPPMDGTSLVPFLTQKAKTHRDWIYSYAGPAQVIRTKTHLLEARSPFLGNEQGRLYFTGENREKADYKLLGPADSGYETVGHHFDSLLDSIPPHLCHDHSYWSTDAGKEWLAANAELEEVAGKLLVDVHEPAKSAPRKSIFGTILSGLLFYERWSTGNGHPLFLFPDPGQFSR